MAKRQTQTKTTPANTDIQAYTCKCKVHENKPRNLALRRDLAGEVGGKAKLALCIFAKPASVHEWSSEANDYVLRDDLEFKNNQVVFKEGGVVYAAAKVPSLADLDTDDSPEEPEERERPGNQQPDTGDHVDLDRDSYY